MAEEASTPVGYDPFTDYLGLKNLLLPTRRVDSGLCRSSVRETITEIRPNVVGDLNRATKLQVPDFLTDLDEATELQVCGTKETQTPYQENHTDVHFIRGSIEPITTDEMHHLMDMMQNFFVNRLYRLPRTNSLAPSGSSRQTLYCAFCRQNGEMKNFYSTHDLKDRFGRVTCPVLRSYTCPQCQATGDNAHTLKYCPWAKKENGLPLARALRAGRNCTGQRPGQMDY